MTFMYDMTFGDSTSGFVTSSYFYIDVNLAVESDMISISHLDIFKWSISECFILR